MMSVPFSVTTSWNLNSSKSLTNLMSVDGPNDHVERNDDINHSVNFVQLMKPNDECPCTITISLEEPYQITKVLIMSEGRIVEVYGYHEEYITTARGVLLTDDTTQLCYNIQIDLNSLQDIMLQFPTVNSSLWVYGITLVVQQNASPLVSNRFNYKNIDDILRTSRVPITEKAEKAKTFIQNYSTFRECSFFDSSTRKHPDFQTVLKMLEGEYKSFSRPVGEMGRNMTKYLSNFIGSSTKPENESAPEDKSLQKDLKQYVDQSIEQLEERVRNSFKLQIQELETRQNEKLDAILSLLKNKS